MSYVTAYEDVVIVARRSNAREIKVRIDASPAGRMTEAVTVAFPVQEGVELRTSFFSGSVRGGRAEITIDEAVAIGTRLADVLFPKTVFRLFAESLGKVVGRPNTGLRIRLDMDASLVDLPWEYVRRRDREDVGLMSGFLLLDPSISMVRQRGDPNIAIEAIKGRQSLSFVGTMWETGGDLWQVKKEFGLLCQALKPIADFIEPKFATATRRRPLSRSGGGRRRSFTIRVTAISTMTAGRIWHGRCQSPALGSRENSTLRRWPLPWLRRAPGSPS